VCFVYRRVRRAFLVGAGRASWGVDFQGIVLDGLVLCPRTRSLARGYRCGWDLSCMRWMVSLLSGVSQLPGKREVLSACFCVCFGRSAGVLVIGGFYLRAPGVFGVVAPGGGLSPCGGVLYVASCEPRGLLWEVPCVR
jgi:hypothetical protein